MTLDHDTSRRAKKARPLVVGDNRCHVLGPGNKWIDAFVTGITDSGRSYETSSFGGHWETIHEEPLSHHYQEALTYQHMHASFLQCNAVPSATSNGNAPSERQNSVISGCQQLANGQKTVLSGNLKGSIKQTNTSQSLMLSETVPDRSGPAEQTSQDWQGLGTTLWWPALCRIPPRRQPGHDTSTRNRREFKLNVTWPRSAHSNQADTGNYKAFRPQRATTVIQWLSYLPVRSLYQRPPLASLQCHLPSSPSGSSSTESTSTSGTDSSSSETSSESSSQSSSNALNPLRQAVQPAHRGPHHLNCLRWNVLSIACLQVHERSSKAILWRGAKWTTWETSSSVSPYWSKLSVNHRTIPRPVSVPPVANMPLPPYPRQTSI